MRHFSQAVDAIRNIEPRGVNDIPVRDGRDFVEKAQPPEGAERVPTGLERDPGTSPIGRKTR